MMDSLLDPFSSFASFSKPARRTNQSSKRSNIYRSSSQQTQTPNVVSNISRENNGKTIKYKYLIVFNIFKYLYFFINICLNILMFLK